MAIKFQYNKTSLQQLEKQLKIRKRTLPIIKSKESALRVEVKKCKDDLVRLETELEQSITRYDSMFALWNEFDPTLVSVRDVNLSVRKIAGTRIPVLDGVDFDVREFSLFSQPNGIMMAFAYLRIWPAQPYCANSLRPSSLCSRRHARRPLRRSICLRRCRFLVMRMPYER